MNKVAYEFGIKVAQGLLERPDYGVLDMLRDEGSKLLDRGSRTLEDIKNYDYRGSTLNNLMRSSDAINYLKNLPTQTMGGLESLGSGLSGIAQGISADKDLLTPDLRKALLDTELSKVTEGTGQAAPGVLAALAAAGLLGGGAYSLGKKYLPKDKQRKPSKMKRY